MFRWLSNHPKRCATVALALCCAGLGWMLLARSSGPGAALVRASYDSYFKWFGLAGGSPGDCPVVIIYLDLDSQLSKGLDLLKPWPRRLHAQLLHRLKSAGARAVVFDIVFDGPGADVAADRALEEALRAQGSAVLAAEISFASQATSDDARGRTMKLALPMDSFRNAAAAWGLGELSGEADFTVRQQFTGRDLDGEMRPSLTWAAGRVLGLGSVNQEAGTRWLRYYGPPFTLPHVSVAKAMDPRDVDDAVFRDKIVFIGARAKAGLTQERRDEFRSPFHSWLDRDLFMPGVEVHATQMLNLIRSDWLTRWSAGAEWWVVTLAGILFALCCMRCVRCPRVRRLWRAAGP
jgi:adenylate cyclase